MHNLKEALREVYESELNTEIAKAQMQDEHQFSPEHTARMKQCIAKHSHPISRFFARTGVRAACILLVCVMLSISAMQADAIWEPFKGFLIEKLTGETSLSYRDETNTGQIDAITEYYTLSGMPDGYALQYSEQTSTHAFYFYDNHGDTIFFAQYVKSHYRDARIDDESTLSNYTDDDGQTYLIIEHSDCVTYLWDNGEYILHVNVPVNFDKKEVIDLCRSAKSQKSE